MIKKNFMNNIKRFYILARGIPLSLISLCIRTNPKFIVFNSFHNTSFDSNSKYFFLWLIKNHPEYKIKFVINDMPLRDVLNQKLGNYFIETHTIAGAFNALHASVWIVSTFDLPVGGLFHRIKRTIVHLGHGTPLKNLGLLEKNLSFIKKSYYLINKNNIAYSLSSSPRFIDIIASFTGLPPDKILISGQPRNDQLFEPESSVFSNMESTKHTKVLYAPTWRPYADTVVFPFDDFSFEELDAFLTTNNITIYLRLHPRIEDTIPAQLLKIKNIQIFNSEEYPEIMDYLNMFDILVTDYSSIYFDYLLLDRPILFLPYDRKQYDEEIGFTVPYDEFTPGDKVYSWAEFRQSLLKYSQNPKKDSQLRVSMSNVCNIVQRENCAHLYALLKTKQVFQ